MSDHVSDSIAAADIAAHAADLERQLVGAQERLVRAELKAEAVRAGMVDLDGVKLIDTSKLKLDENGEVAGVQGILRELRRAKPWLFGSSSSSSTAGVPPAQSPKAKLATEMSIEEWQKARAELLRRR
jgi:hypothetical protein